MRDQVGKNGENQRSESGREAPKKPREAEAGRKRKGRNVRPSSQNRNRKWTKENRREGKSPKAKAKGKHLRNSCGSESRKGERKQTESRVQRIWKESMRNQAGEKEENQRSESGREAPKTTHCEGETGRKRKGRNRKLSS